MQVFFYVQRYFKAFMIIRTLNDVDRIKTNIRFAGRKY